MKIKLIPFGAEHAPKRGHYNDAGADVFAVQDTWIGPGETVSLGLGFGVEIPDGFMGLLFSRSSLAAKGVACEMPPIDGGYRGEIHAVLTNHRNLEYCVRKGDRIGQLVVLPVIYADFVDELGEERKAGAFGSTGR